MIHALLAKLLTVKAAAAIGGVALAGGVAFAAGTGAIPNPLRHPAPTAPATPAVPPQVSPVPTETWAVIGLCRAYLADASGSTLDTPAFQMLIAKAGGKDNITTYCTQLIAVTSVQNGATPNPADPTPGQPATTPTPARPGAVTPTPSHPTAAPTPTPTHPTGPATPGRR